MPLGRKAGRLFPDFRIKEEIGFDRAKRQPGAKLRSERVVPYEKRTKVNSFFIYS